MRKILKERLGTATSLKALGLFFLGLVFLEGFGAKDALAWATSEEAHKNCTGVCYDYTTKGFYCWSTGITPRVCVTAAVVNRPTSSKFTSDAAKPVNATDLAKPINAK